MVDPWGERFQMRTASVVSLLLHPVRHFGRHMGNEERGLIRIFGKRSQDKVWLSIDQEFSVLRPPPMSTQVTHIVAANTHE